MNDLEPVRFSRLKLFSKSAAHYAAGYSEETGAMRKGTAIHSFMIGDGDRVKVYSGKRDKRSKAFQEFLEGNPDCDILSPREMKDVSGMRRSLDSHPRALGLLDGIREERVSWEIGGRSCAGTPDVVHVDRATGRKRIVELKSGVSSKPELFLWQARKMHYASQLSWYAQGLELSMAYAPGPVVEQYIVAVESTAPYPVTVFRVDDSMRRRGERQCRLWFEQLLICERTGHYPGYVENDVDWVDDDNELEWEDEAAA